MLWQPSPSPDSSSSSSSSRSPTDESPHLVHPVTASALTAITLLTAIYMHKNYIRRFPTAPHIPLSRYRTKRSLFGTVTSVGDGDNIRIYHTPGGRLLGWGWWRKIPGTRAELKDQTIHIRLAGIDAPEAAHWGKTAQPYSAEALAWLRAYTVGKQVRVYIYRQDRYERAVGTVWVRRGLWRKDVGLQMLKAGLATVYEAKTDAEFGSEQTRLKYVEAERVAKAAKLGIWGLKKGIYVSPYEFKREGRASGSEF